MKAVDVEEELEVLRGTAEVFAALGDVVRLRVLVKLAGAGRCSIAELTEGTGVTRQSVTKHLQVMETAGVVEGRLAGREKMYSLEPGSLSEAMACLDMVSEGWDRALGRLKRKVEG
jgi:DNA-binding transcriptional ArsR family regulator